MGKIIERKEQSLKEMLYEDLVIKPTTRPVLTEDIGKETRAELQVRVGSSAEDLDLYFNAPSTLRDHQRKEREMFKANFQKATDLADYLSEKYQVTIELLPTNEEFDSNEAIARTVKENIFFISLEQPEETAKTTEYLLKFQKCKQRILVDSATAKRIDRSKESNEILGEKINEIRQEYRESHNGKDAPLSKIAEILNERHIDAPGGKASKWYAETVKRVEKNTEIKQR